jgi:ABC-type uncharacterized transport system auxiliary subunit
VGGRPIHYYTINPPGAPVAAPQPNGPVLVIGRISTPEALQDGRIRYRAGNNEAGAYEYHRWTERPSAMVQDLLLQTLRASGKYSRVLESSSSTEGDYLVRGRLREFAEIDDTPGIQTRVSLRLELVDRQAGGVIWDRDYNRDAPVDGKTMNAVVLSMEHNLQQVIDEAASAIEGAATRHVQRSGPQRGGTPGVSQLPSNGVAGPKKAP